jgi:hypothetical protein
LAGAFDAPGFVAHWEASEVTPIGKMVIAGFLPGPRETEMRPRRSRAVSPRIADDREKSKSRDTRAREMLTRCDFFMPAISQMNSEA